LTARYNHHNNADVPLSAAANEGNLEASRFLNHDKEDDAVDAANTTGESGGIIFVK
jgi:hypothetical protein